MWAIIGLVGFFGLIVFLIRLIVRIINGKPKKPIVLGLLVCIVLFAIGVSSTPSSNVEKDDEPDASSAQVVTTPEHTPTLEQPLEPDANADAAKSEKQITPTNKNIRGTNLFEEVYAPFALWEGARLFEGAKVYAENCGYVYEITEASETSVASVKFFSGDDYVYVVYAPDVEDIEIMTTVSYYQGSSNSEVSMSNYSTGRNREYDKFQTHVIGEQNNSVDGIDDQREFLFLK